jgi:hypothetical protein
MVCLLPNSVFPSNHLRLEVEFELLSKLKKAEKETGEGEEAGISKMMA